MSKNVIFLLMDAMALWDKQYITTLPHPASRRIAGALWEYKKDKALQAFYGTASKKFSLVSCQFSIHYFFKTDKTLSNFAANVSKNLENGGRFFGTCLDGKLVNSVLEKTGLLRGEEDGVTLWQIEKRYGELSEEIRENYGKTISVYMESINQKMDEFLVDFDLLELVMLENDLILEETGLFSDVYDEFSKSDPDFKNSIENGMTNAQKRYSFMNRWFVFRK
jgi:hypothetical protein